MSSSAPSRSREIFRRLTAEGSRAVRSVRENCHHRPSIRATRPSFSIAFRSFWLTTLSSAGVVASYRTHVRPRRSLGSFEPLAWRMRFGAFRALRRTGRLRKPHYLAEKPDRAPAEATPGGCCLSSRPERTRTPRSRLHGQARRVVPAWCPGIEGGRPGFYMGDVFEAACQRLEQLLLFS
jgi:hypothetical protein